MFGACALAGFLIMLLLAAVGSDDLISRNLIALWVPLALMLSAGLAALRPRLLGGFAVVVLCAIGVFVIGETAFNRSLQRPDWRAAARLLGPAPPAPVPVPGAELLAGPARPVTRGRIVIIQHYYFPIPLAIYQPGLRWMTRPVRTREIDVIADHSIASGQFCWWGAACNLVPSTLPASYPLPGFRPVWTHHAAQFSVLRLTAARPEVVTRRELRLALGRANRSWSTVTLVQR